MATKLDQKNAKSLCEKGLTLFKQNKIHDSNIAYNEAIKLNPEIVRNKKYMKSLDDYINTGWNLFKAGNYNEGNYNESFEAFDMATQLYPKLYPKIADAWCGKGWTLLGWALLKQEKNNIDEKDKNKIDDSIKDSIKAFDEAIQMDPEYADAWCGRGQALLKQDKNKIDESNMAFDEAIRLNPNIVRKYVNEGWNLIIEAMKGGKEADKKYDVSILYFNNAIEIRSVHKNRQPDLAYADACCGKGWAKHPHVCNTPLKQDKNKIDESNMAFDEANEEAEKLNQNIAAKWISDSSKYLCKSEDYSIANLYFNIAIRLKPDCSKAWNGKGNALYQMKKRPDDADEARKKAIQLDKKVHRRNPCD